MTVFKTVHHSSGGDGDGGANNELGGALLY